MANLSNINGKFVVEQTTGYVGVGTTDPSYPIEVLNASAEIALNASGGSIYRLRSDSTDSFRINKNGVGDRLVIDGSGNAIFEGSVRVTNPTQSNYWLYNAAKNNGFLLGRSLASNDAQDFFIFDTIANAARLTIDSSGNAGINASASLRFNGVADNTHAVGYDSTIDGSFLRGQLGMRFLTGTGGGSERMRITSGGNVGINYTGPFNQISGTETTLAISNSNVPSLYLNNSSTNGHNYILLSGTDGAFAIYDKTVGANRFIINSSGDTTFNGDINVGGGFLGVIDPVSGNFSGEIKVGGAGSSRRLVLKQDTVLEYLIGAEGGSTVLKFGTGTGAAERMRITSGGNVLMGNGSQANNSDCNLTLRDTQFVGLDFKSSRTVGNIGGTRYYGTASDSVPVAQFLVEVDGSYNFYNGTNGAQKIMEITSAGALLVNRTSSLAGVHTIQGNETGGGTSILTVYNSNASDISPAINAVKNSATTSSDARFIQFYANATAVPMGGIVGNGASNVQFASLSDIREKENIKTIESSLDKISKLNPVEFDWKKSGEHIDAGFIAQEVENIFPEYVVKNISNEGEEERKGLTGGMTSGIVAHLVKSIQELKADNDSLKARIETLENN